MTEPSPAPSNLIRAGKFLLQLLVTGAVTWFILKAVGFNLSELRAFDLSGLAVNWGLLALSSGVLLAAYLFSAGLWGLMVREIGGHEVDCLDGADCDNAFVASLIAHYADCGDGQQYCQGL